jgi:hypothetical protein
MTALGPRLLDGLDHLDAGAVRVRKGVRYRPGAVVVEM